MLRCLAFPYFAAAAAGYGRLAWRAAISAAAGVFCTGVGKVLRARTRSRRERRPHVFFASLESVR